MPNKESVEELKKLGNDCVKAGNHTEAILHYSHAIQEDPKNHLLYSNRSLGFLKVGQLYYALTDALEVIKLQPRWAKGYFRKGEAEFAAQNFTDAVISYRQAMIMEPTDEGIRQALRKTEKEITKRKKAEFWMPFCGIGVGVAIGFLIVISDEFMTKEPTIKYLLLKVLMIVLFGCIGYATTVSYRYYMKEQQKSLLEPPIDLLEALGQKAGNTKNIVDSTDGDTPEVKHTRRKGGASAARQRYKKGKS